MVKGFIFKQNSEDCMDTIDANEDDSDIEDNSGYQGEEQESENDDYDDYSENESNNDTDENVSDDDSDADESDYEEDDRDGSNDENEFDLNISVESSASQDARDTNSFLSSARKVAGKLRSIIKKVNNSNPIRSYVIKKQKSMNISDTFYLDFKVRWNTTYIMIERALKLKPIINDITANSSQITNLSVSY